MPSLAELISLDNLDDPIPWMNYPSSMFGLVISSLVITTICVFLRLYIRFIVTKSPGYDDYCIIFTFIIIVASNVGCFNLINNGLGGHFIELGLAGMAKFTRTFWWSLSLYNMALALVKLSLLCQYLRIYDERPDIKQPWLRMVILVMIGIVSAWGLVQSLLAWIPCNPIEADWDFTDTPATRWGYGSRDRDEFSATFYQHSSSNMVLDMIILAIPMFSKALWDTAATDKKSRRGMFALFILGSLTVICSIVRFASQVSHKAGTYPSFDPTWYGTSTTILSVLEVDLATIAATLPVFWPHLRRNIEAILITHEVEVKITRQSVIRDGAGRRQGDDGIQRGWMGGGGGDHKGSVDGLRQDQESSDPWSLPRLNLRNDAIMLTEVNVDGQRGEGNPSRKFGSLRDWRSPVSRESGKDFLV